MSDTLRRRNRPKIAAGPWYGDCDTVGTDMRVFAALVAALISAAPGVTHATAAGDTAPVVVPAPAGDTAPLAPLPPPPVAPEPPREKGRWYGWELILSDTLFLLIAGDGANERPESGLGSTGFTVGLLGVAVVPSALHFVHGNRRRAGIGLLVRGGVVAFVASVWAASSDSTSTSSSCAGMDHCSGIDIDGGDLVLGGLALVALGGGITYAVSEYFWLSRVPVAAPRARGPRSCRPPPAPGRRRARPGRHLLKRVAKSCLSLVAWRA